MYEYKNKYARAVVAVGQRVYSSTLVLVPSRYHVENVAPVKKNA